MPRATTRAIAAGLGLVLLVGLGVIVFGPARGAREDIGAQRRLVAAQLQTVQAQLQTVQEQLDLQQRQYRLARHQLRVAQQTRDIAWDTRAIARDTGERVDQLFALTQHVAQDADQQLSISRLLATLAQRIEDIARQTLRHARSLDHKTGPTAP
jgi:hypothetical protein